MRRFALVVLLASFLLPVHSLAQAPLLLDPAKAPMTLKGGWIHKRTGNKSDIVVKIEKMQPDGTFTGRLDFYNMQKKSFCKAIDEPIKEGKVTADSLKVVADGGSSSTCGNLILVFKRGTEKFLEGGTQSDVGQGGSGHKMWLDAPN